MNYVKKMCILRQIKQGFSGDGKTLSGLIKAEQYGKNLAVEVSIINFAPLASGEYYCLLSDGRGKTEMLALRGKSTFNILSDIDISEGFCGVICYVKTEVVPVAYGINGNGSYDWRAILNKALPPVFPRQKKESAYAFTQTIAEPIEEKKEGDVYESKEVPLAELAEPQPYDDEAVATENYYEEKTDERNEPLEDQQNAHAESADEEQAPSGGTDPSEDGNAASVRKALATDPDGYYLSVKRELDELFATYPRDDTLKGAFEHGEWVRIRGTKAAPEYLVGALFIDGKARYLCYAIKARDKDSPPEEIRSVCSFVPVSPLVDAEGFFVIFQSAGTGECLKPPRL